MSDDDIDIATNSNGEENTLASLRKISKVSLSVKELFSLATILVSIGIAISGFYQIQKEVEDIKDTVTDTNKVLDDIEKQIIKIEVNVDNIAKEEFGKRLIKIEHNLDFIKKELEEDN